jgi:hypothetical protein
MKPVARSMRYANSAGPATLMNQTLKKRRVSVQSEFEQDADALMGIRDMMGIRREGVAITVEELRKIYSVTTTDGFGYFWTYRLKGYGKTLHLSTFYDLLSKFGLNRQL